MLLKPALFACLKIALATSQASAVVLYRNNFEDDPVGMYTVENLEADWLVDGGVPPLWNNGVDEGRVAIADGEKAFGDKSLVVTYPQGETNDGKTQWKLHLGAGYEELFLSYRIRFDDDFDFVLGGKLPGLIGGDGNTGGTKPSGTDGWSARMMWRTNGSGGSPTSGNTANMVQYVYHPDQPTTHGEDFRWDDSTPAAWQTFDSENWYHVQHRIVMNTPGQNGGPGQPDGIVQAWLDGKLVLDVQDIRFRDIASLQIDQMYFSTFFGGSSTIWAATKNEQVFFDDFVIATEFISQSADFNGDDTVDAADYTVWRDSRFQTGEGLPADGDGDGIVGNSDYDLWLANFGTSISASTSGTIPEPSSYLLLLLGMAFCPRLFRT